MKIMVTVKQVPDTSGKVAVNPDGTLDRASMQTIINPDDLNAVEAALALKDELGCRAVRPSTVTPRRSARRSLRSCICRRSPTPVRSRRTAIP